MHTPIIADTKPIAQELQSEEEYYWCACGQSKNQPFCDGSHQGTEFQPVAFTAEKNDTVYLCGCKKTGRAPYCDGSHSR